MPARYTKRERKIIYQFLVQRDEERCQECGESPPDVLLEVDHKDGEYRNHDPANLRLLCRSCNRRDGVRRRQISVSSRLSEFVCVGRVEELATFKARELLDYQRGSLEMKANDIYEVPFINWLYVHLGQHGQILWTDAADGGAQAVGCSPSSTERYLKKLTSFEGPLTRVRNESRQWVVKPKN